MTRTVVLNVVGLSRSLLGADTPRLSAMSSAAATVGGMLPAVTCSVQSTYLTGKLPRDHGIVGNGWYFRDLSEVFFWRQSNRLVEGEKIWHMGKRRDPSFTCANSFWWYNMATEADWSVTPRPIYCSDGRKIPDCYAAPDFLREELTRDLGRFPLFQFWGPAASIRSSRWIADAAVRIEERFRPTLQLVYLPHLDYILQKAGPSGDIAADLREIDTLCGELIDYFCGRGCRIVVLSEYGIEAVSHAVHPNRVLRDAGFLAVKEDLGKEYLDTYAGRAFAVADHQVAHVYVRDRRDVPEVARLLEQTPGVAEVLGEEGKRAAGLDHPRSGELVLVANKGVWFSYYFWNDDDRAPDYARTVNIHAKPGYDPCELFLDPGIRFPKAVIGGLLLRKALGFRTLMSVIPLDASLVRGSHGRAPSSRDEGPLLMTSEPDLLPSAHLEPTDVCRVLVEHVFG